MCRFCGRVCANASGLHDHGATHRGTAPHTCGNDSSVKQIIFLRHRYNYRTVTLYVLYYDG